MFIFIYFIMNSLIGRSIDLFPSLFLMLDISMFISWIKPLFPLICRFMNSLLLCVSIPRQHYFVRQSLSLLQKRYILTITM